MTQSGNMADSKSSWVISEQKFIDYLQNADVVNSETKNNITQLAYDNINDILQTMKSGKCDNLLKNYKLCFSLIQNTSSSRDFIKLIEKQLELAQILLLNGSTRECLEELNITVILISGSIIQSPLMKPPALTISFEFSFSENIYNDEQIFIMAKFKTLILKVYSKLLIHKKSVEYKTPSHKEISELISNDSAFYSWFHGLSSKRRSDISAQLTSIFIELALSTKTIFKLVFLFRALQYSIFTDQISLELIEKITHDSQKMIAKNSSVVYKFTSDLFYSICKQFLRFNIDMTPLTSLINIYMNIQLNSKDNLDWKCFSELDNNKTSCAEKLVSLLKGLDISNFSMLSIMLESSSDWILLSSEQFIARIFMIIKNSSFEDSKSQNLIISILKFINKALDNTKFKELFQVLGIFDLITINIKKMKPSIENVTFISNCLNTMFDSLKSNHQEKRIKNFVNLFFYFGGKLLTISPEGSVELWMNCANLEYFLFTNQGNKDNFFTFLTRLSRISNLLIESEHYDHSCMFLMKIFDCYSNISEPCNLFSLETKINNELIVPIKLLTKLLLQTQSPSMFVSISSDEKIIVNICIHIIKLITASKYPNKDLLVSKIILTLKNELHDNGLFVYFLSRISFIIEFNIGFKNSSLEFEEASAVYPYQNLIKPHMYMLQSFSNGSVVEIDTILNSYKSIEEWCDSPTDYGYISDYESLVIDTLVIVLNYNKLHSYAMKFLEKYLTSRASALNEEQFENIILSLGISYLNNKKLGKFQLLTNQYFTTFENSKNTFRKLEMNLCCLEYSILGNRDTVQEELRKSLQIMSTNVEFSVSKQTDKRTVIKLLFLLAKISHLSGLYNCRITNNYTESIFNYKREIRILQSILKNFIITNENGQFFNMNFNYILKLSFSESMLNGYELLVDTLSTIGLGKDFEFYLNEFESFIFTQPSLVLKFYFNLKFTNFQISLQNKEKSNKYFRDALSFYKEMKDIIGFLLTSCFLDTREYYCRFVGNRLLAEEIGRELDAKINNELKKMENIEDQRPVIEFWIDSISRRYKEGRDKDKDCSLWKQYFVELSSHSEARALLLYDKCSELIERNPKLSVLRDSIVSYPLSKVSSETFYNVDFKGIVETLKNCCVEYSTVLKSRFTSLPVDLQRNDIEKLISCFINLLRYDRCAKDCDIKDISWVCAMHDRYKYIPFLYEKELAKHIENPKEILPDIRTVEAVDYKYNMEIIKGLKFLLPSGWIVVTIDFSHVTNCLTITKIDKRFDEPIVLELSLNRPSLKDLRQIGLRFDDALRELSSIITDSDQSTQLEVTSNIKTYDDKVHWWETRKNLDTRLQVLLESIEMNWFCGFNSLFVTSHVDGSLVKLLKDEMISLIKNNLTCKNMEIRHFINRMKSLHDGLFELFLQIDNIDLEKVEDLFYFLLDTISGHESPKFAYDELDITGICDIICQKLKNWISTQPINNSASDHIVLIPGMECVRIPWESIPCLRKQSVSRMPSLKQLSDLLVHKKDLLLSGVNVNKGYYVINPGGDLQKTEKNFRPKFEQLCGWNGIFGERPQEKDLIEGMKNSNLYIYAGHGGGEQYMKSKTIKKADKVPPTLLLGCSSGLLKGKGNFHPYGTAYNYINGGCPMLLANLWDVTDKDIDTFTLKLLEQWGLFVDYDSFDSLDLDNTNCNMGRCVSDSRNICKLKYLNGAAPVLYGLPLSVENS